MRDWINKLFIERPYLFLKVMDKRWTKTEQLVNGIVRLLDDFGVKSGNLLDLCCGNGRVSIHMAKKGFRAVESTYPKPSWRTLEERRKSTAFPVLPRFWRVM